MAQRRGGEGGGAVSELWYFSWYLMAKRLSNLLIYMRLKRKLMFEWESAARGHGADHVPARTVSFG